MKVDKHWRVSGTPWASQLVAPSVMTTFAFHLCPERTERRGVGPVHLSTKHLFATPPIYHKLETPAQPSPIGYLAKIASMRLNAASAAACGFAPLLTMSAQAI
jgi:hypothetical protein